MCEEGRVECGSDVGAPEKVSLGEAELLCFSTAPLYTTSRNIWLPPATLTPEFSLMLVSLLFPNSRKAGGGGGKKHPGAVKAETAAELH